MKAILTQLALAALLLAIALPATAQGVRLSAPPAAPDAWTRNLGAQLSESLQSPVEAIRNSALEQITNLARADQSGYDFTAAIEPLVEIYREDSDDHVRIAALAALHAIGDDAGMQQVRRYALDQPSRPVLIASIGALVDYYGTGTFRLDEEAGQIARQMLETQSASEPSAAIASL